MEDRQITREKRWTQTTKEEVDINNKRRGRHEEEAQPKLKNIKFFLIVKISKRRGKMVLNQKPK